MNLRAHRSLLLLVAVFTAFASAAQPALRRGYIVNAKGDTLRGYAKVNPKKVYENHYKVMFKDTTGSQKTYKPEKIRAYGYDDVHYLSITEDGESLFFQVLSRGHINLYKFMFEAMRMNKVVFMPEYYLAKGDSGKLELVKEHRFRKQIADWMEDNPSMLDTYEDKDPDFYIDRATALIDRYNAWKATQKK